MGPAGWSAVLVRVVSHGYPGDPGGAAADGVVESRVAADCPFIDRWVGVQGLGRAVGLTRPVRIVCIGD
jgi:hypothetical protein